MTIAEQIAYFTALQWHVDQGIDEVLADTPGQQMVEPTRDRIIQGHNSVNEYSPPSNHQQTFAPNPEQPPSAPFQGTPVLREEAAKCAGAASTLEELQTALAGFEGLAIRKTATHLVFGDGNPLAPVMLIGDAPETDEDRLGRPFVGASGQLLDKILSSAGLNRNATGPAESLYITNVINWRPPGNRSPSPQEIEISLPFVERHIALVRPQLLILCGGVAAKALLGTEENISRLRGRWHNYTPRTPGLEAQPIPTLCTYHPSYLLRTPSQKKAVWSDMIALMQKRQELGIIAKAA